MRSSAAPLCNDAVDGKIEYVAYVVDVFLCENGETEDCGFDQSVEHIVYDFDVYFSEFARFCSADERRRHNVPQFDDAAHNALSRIDARFLQLYQIQKQNAEQFFIFTDCVDDAHQHLAETFFGVERCIVDNLHNRRFYSRYELLDAP